MNFVFQYKLVNLCIKCCVDRQDNSWFNDENKWGKLLLRNTISVATHIIEKNSN